MKISRFIRHYIPRSFHPVQTLGWVAFIVLLLITICGSVLPFGPVLTFTMKVGLLFVSSLIISLGNILELQSHNRRIRPIEPIAKAAPGPLIFLFLIHLMAKAHDGSGILLELLLFFGFIVFICNIKWIWDHLTMNREVVTCAEMKELERRADEGGLSYLQMMENAGTGAFGYICEEEYDWVDGMLIFCGSGNNGGDGFVIARKAMEYGCPSTVILPCGKPKTPDAITNFGRILSDAAIEIIIPDEDTDLTEILDPKGKVIVDSIFGTGFHGEPRGISKKAIEYINDLRHTNMIYAIDVPSGLPGDEGPSGPKDQDKEPDASINTASPDSPDSTGTSAPAGASTAAGKRPVFYNAVCSDCVISFHARKPIHMNRERNITGHMGKIIVADIGITRALDPSLE